MICLDLEDDLDVSYIYTATGLLETVEDGRETTEYDYEDAIASSIAPTQRDPIRQMGFQSPTPMTQQAIEPK